MKTTLLVTALAALSLFGCANEHSENTSSASSSASIVREAVSSFGVRADESFTPRAEGQSSLSSAATPLGWAAESDRRAQEEAFARGEDTQLAPPNAIGGGPTDFKD
jgi:hypothetical protein